MVEKYLVEEFMNEKFTVEEFMVEPHGEMSSAEKSVVKSWG